MMLSSREWLSILQQVVKTTRFNGHVVYVIYRSDIVKQLEKMYPKVRSCSFGLHNACFWIAMNRLCRKLGMKYIVTQTKKSGRYRGRYLLTDSDVDVELVKLSTSGRYVRVYKCVEV